ncbi:hypothetical protein B0H10DRAFT_694167 [Mycena sp. CBHHK59/15]|nr:hypothetical protein B0H10DRAFT_694167 [Mycena sp. CBHHK59/15]
MCACLASNPSASSPHCDTRAFVNVRHVTGLGRIGKEVCKEGLGRSGIHIIAGEPSLRHFSNSLAAPLERSEKRVRGACTARTRTAPSDVSTPRYAGETSAACSIAWAMTSRLTAKVKIRGHAW